MIDRIRYIWQLLVLASILVILGILLLPRIEVEISLVVYLVSLGSVTLISLITYFLLEKGISRQDRDGVVWMLAGIGTKFLLYLLYILLFWVVTKNITKPFILTFFSLYLIFTLFLAGSLIKLLNNK
jgi:hypothetical protein